MRRMSVKIVPEFEWNGNVEQMTTCMPEMIESWKNQLESAGELLEFNGMEPSNVNSKNFQVLGMLFRTFNMFLHDHENPKQIVIYVKDMESAKKYKAIYNYYVPLTKADRMDDHSWD